MTDQSLAWSNAAARYEQEFIDPYVPGARNPTRAVLARLAAPGGRVVADLGCGIGPLIPFLAEHFGQVLAVDFAEGMLARARVKCNGLTNVTFFRRPLSELTDLPGPVDVAVAVNSLVLPDLADLEACLGAVHALLRPGGTFVGVVPAMDAVHYLTMLLLDRARQAGMPPRAARKNAGMHAEHELYDFAFSEFRYRELVQHFWQPFEVPYRLRRAGFRRVRMAKVALSWDQFSGGKDLAGRPPPWDWFFQAEKPNKRSGGPA